MRELSPDDAPGSGPGQAMRLIAEATASIDASTARMAANLDHLREDARSMRWLHGLTIALLGVSIAFLGWVLWYSSTQHAQIAEILRLMQPH